MKNTTRVLKEANKYLIMQTILQYQPLTIEEIVRRTMVSRPTVLEVIKELQENDYIIKEGQVKSTGGRPADLILINAEACYAIGVDLEFPIHTTRLAVTNAAKEIIGSKEIHFEDDADASKILEGLMDEIDSIVKQTGISMDKVAGIGLGLPGNVDEPNGVSIHIERIRNWDDIHVRDILEEKFHVPVYIKNDVHLLAEAEREKYMSSDIQDFLYIGLRSGIGSAIFYHGRAVDGRQGNAGFIGHTTVNPEGPLCSCGRHGCLDAFASEMAMNKEYKAQCIETGNYNAKEETHQTVLDFIERAEKGEEISCQILKQSAFYIGIAVANMIKTLEITTVIIGGYPQIEDTEFIKEIRKTAKQYMMRGYENEIDIRVGSLRQEEYPLGACCHVLSNIFEKPKLSLKV